MATSSGCEKSIDDETYVSSITRPKAWCKKAPILEHLTESTEVSGLWGWSLPATLWKNVTSVPVISLSTRYRLSWYFIIHVFLSCGIPSSLSCRVVLTHDGIKVGPGPVVSPTGKASIIAWGAGSPSHLSWTPRYECFGRGDLGSLRLLAYTPREARVCAG